MTSLRETGENILLPYPTRQPARSRKVAFAVTARVMMHFRIIFSSYITIGTRNCAVNMTSVYLDSLEV